jgi:hypothetical protein
VVVVVSIRVVDVDVDDEVVDNCDRSTGAVVDGGGMHVDGELDDVGGSVVVIGAAAASAAKVPASTATAIAVSNRSGAAEPPTSRRCTARTPRPVTIAKAPMSSVAPKDPPELGRLHTWPMALEGRGRQRNGPTVSVPVTRMRLNCNEFAICGRADVGGYSARRRSSSRPLPASIPGSCTATCPKLTAARSATIDSASSQFAARGPSTRCRLYGWSNTITVLPS